MSKKEIDELVKKIEKRTQEIKNDPKKASKYLREVGLIDEKGNTEKPYI